MTVPQITLAAVRKTPFHSNMLWICPLLAETAAAAATAVTEAAAAPRPDVPEVMLIAALTIFVLGIIVGIEIIQKIPPTLHTPLMSGSNAISGITVVGAVVAAGSGAHVIGSILGFIAVVLAMINVVGGFYVTHRMLQKFRRS